MADAAVTPLVSAASLACPDGILIHAYINMCKSKVGSGLLTVKEVPIERA